MIRRVENPSKKRIAHGTLFELVRTSWAKMIANINYNHHNNIHPSKKLGLLRVEIKPSVIDK